MQEETSVLSNEQAGAGCRRLRLSAPGIAASAVPGQFVHVRVPALDEGAMRRPISICGADPRSGELTLLFKVVGRGTKALAGVRPGDAIDLLGPLGNGFPVPSDHDGPVALVGGGYGVAPLLFLATRAIAGGVAKDAIHLFCGGRTKDDLLLQDEFAALGVALHPATEDGSHGARGRVTAPLLEWLEGLAARAGGKEPTSGAKPPPVFACGPAPMLRAIDDLAKRFGFRAALSFDRRMACGVGACLGCVQRVRDADAAGGVKWARVCTDGPVFPAGAIVWD